MRNGFNKHEWPDPSHLNDFELVAHFDEAFELLDEILERHPPGHPEVEAQGEIMSAYSDAIVDRGIDDQAIRAELEGDHDDHHDLRPAGSTASSASTVSTSTATSARR